MIILFYLFSILTLVFALGVIISKNPISSALSLVVSFVALAALFISLNAYFIGIIQILVYAGAVMVLFLFIIMLLDLKAEKERRFHLLALSGGIFLALTFALQLHYVLRHFEAGKQELQPLDFEKAVAARAHEEEKNSIAQSLEQKNLPDVKLLGENLFKNYNFPLQIVGVLLLVSSVGVVILSRRTPNK